jgi:hypothetical protein
MRRRASLRIVGRLGEELLELVDHTSIPGAPTATSPSIYVIADKPTGTIAVIDPTTFETTGEIRALATAPSLNSLAATPGVLWAVNNSGGILQRFDTAG